MELWRQFEPMQGAQPGQGDEGYLAWDPESSNEELSDAPDTARDMSLLVNMAALELSEDPSTVLDTQMINSAFDHESEDSGENSAAQTLPPQHPQRDATGFEHELRAHIVELGHRARETRTLTWQRESIRDLVNRTPSTEAARVWMGSASQIVSAGSQTDNSISDLRTSLDALEQSIGEVVKQLRARTTPIECKLDSNYSWLRERSTLLGLQSTSTVRCPVCLMNTVSHYNDPCGHTFCTMCMAAWKASDCCMCREPIRKRRKLFNVN